jgi:hypothetical protein
MQSFFAKQNDNGKVFAYDPNTSNQASDYFEKAHKNRLLHSYNVPMKDRHDQYVDVIEQDKTSPHGG